MVHTTMNIDFYLLYNPHPGFTIFRILNTNQQINFDWYKFDFEIVADSIEFPTIILKQSQIPF